MIIVHAFVYIVHVVGPRGDSSPDTQIGVVWSTVIVVLACGTVVGVVVRVSCILVVVSSAVATSAVV